MPHQPSRPLTLGFQVLEEIPLILSSLANDVVACYRRHHTSLRSVFVVGSVATGEWTAGVSDLDVVGVTDLEFSTEDDSARRAELLVMGGSWQRHISFINSSVFSLEALHAETPNTTAVGKARIIAVCGLYLWGDKLDFRDYIPTVETMAYERVARAKRLMIRYQCGLIKEPCLRNNPRLLVRSCAKAAIRVLSSITILRGATFHTSPQKTVAMVEEYAPEAIVLAKRALAIVEETASEPHEAMDITEQAMELFYSLYPDFRSP